MMVGAAEYADRVLPMDCLALLCALCNTDDESCLFFSTGALCLFRYTRSLGSLFCKFAPPPSDVGRVVVAAVPKGPMRVISWNRTFCHC